jgi:hypothetical protein
MDAVSVIRHFRTGLRRNSGGGVLCGKKLQTPEGPERRRPQEAGARSRERAPRTHQGPLRLRRRGGSVDSMGPASCRAEKLDIGLGIRGALPAPTFPLPHVRLAYQNDPGPASPIWVKCPGNQAKPRRWGFGAGSGGNFGRRNGEEPETKRARSCERAPRTVDSIMRTESIRGVPFRVTKTLRASNT